MSAEPGKFRIARTPYLAGPLEAIATPGVEEVVFVSGTQVGKTTVQEIALGYWADVDPGPVLIVKPTQAACEEYVKDRIRPLFEASPALKRHTSDRASDNTLAEIQLDTMPIYFGWAGSPQALASRPCRRVIPDEVDKFPPFSGREADPISLARERTATFGYRRCVFLCSTPTTREGAIWRAYEACGVRLNFYVPCPHCGVYQRLAWTQVKWDKQEGDRTQQADAIEQGKLAWYECSACHGEIRDHHKPKMLERGKWATEEQTVDADGTVKGDRPASKRVGFHMSSLYSPWRSFSELAGEWIRAQGDVAALMNFRNSKLAEPFEVLTAKPKADAIRDKANAGHAPGVVPEWAQVLIATADTQKTHWRYVVRAWGYSYRSRLIGYGIAMSLDELRSKTLEAVFSSEAGPVMGVPLLLIDSGGDKTNDVYQAALADPTRIRAVKGATHAQNFPVRETVLKSPPVMLWLIDTGLCKDQLHALINAEDAGRWEVHSQTDEDYCRQMASEHKVFDRTQRREIWQPVSSGAENHYWDCETYQIAAAFKLGLGMQPPAPTPTEQQPPAPSERPQSNFATSFRNQW